MKYAKRGPDAGLARPLSNFYYWESFVGCALSRVWKQIKPGIFEQRNIFVRTGIDPSSLPFSFCKFEVWTPFSSLSPLVQGRFYVNLSFNCCWRKRFKFDRVVEPRMVTIIVTMLHIGLPDFFNFKFKQSLSVLGRNYKIDQNWV